MPPAASRCNSSYFPTRAALEVMAHVPGAASMAQPGRRSAGSVSTYLDISLRADGVLRQGGRGHADPGLLGVAGCAGAAGGGVLHQGDELAGEAGGARRVVAAVVQAHPAELLHVAEVARALQRGGA